MEDDGRRRNDTVTFRPAAREECPAWSVSGYLEATPKTARAQRRVHGGGGGGGEEVE